MNVSRHVSGICLLLAATAQPVSATTMYKTPICAAVLREALRALGNTCVVEQATYRVIQAANGAQELDLKSIGPTEKLKAWAICVGEHWSNTEQALAQPLGIGEAFSIQFKLGECGS